MIEIFTEMFWTTATQCVTLFVPIIAIILLVKIIDTFIIKGTD